MQGTQAKPMGCSRNHWIEGDYVEWYGFRIRHHNLPSEVSKFCDDRCNFPSCMVALVRKDEAGRLRPGLPHGHGNAQEGGSASRPSAHVDAEGRWASAEREGGAKGANEMVQGQLRQIGLWASGESEGGAK